MMSHETFDVFCYWVNILITRDYANKTIFNRRLFGIILLVTLVHYLKWIID